MDNIFSLINEEEKRQQNMLMLIPSENYASANVRKALGSVLTNKYSEGYPGKRYYQGNKIIDEIENLAVERAKKLFSVPRANVQPYSGSPAIAAVYFGLLNPGDKIMGMSLSAGGHLTHGHPNITFSGKYFESIQYGVGGGGLIDYALVEKMALEQKPKMIIAGTTAYPRIVDWEKFAVIADKVGAIFLADISHVAGLIVAGVYPSPAEFAHVITTTTHKTLRGPRGAIIMVTKKGLEKDAQMASKIDKAVFPGLQGGPHDHQTAAIAVCLEEAMADDFKAYGRKIVENAKVLASELTARGFNLVTGGTDTHLILINLKNKNVMGKPFADELEKAGIVVNHNTIPNDDNPPANPSGIRLGTPAVTTRGMGEPEMKIIARLIEEALDPGKIEEVKREVGDLCQKFPVNF